MDELNSEQIQSQQATERPVSVTVFGGLNIIVGCSTLIRFFLMFFTIVTVYRGPFTIGELSYFLLLSITNVGLPVWLIILGIGLLKMKSWARRGSCMYARIRIIVTVIITGLAVTSLIANRSSLPMGELVFMLLGLIETFIHPLLLLIFMQTEKVKRAFGE
jgi:hypothetical protein